jgi:hypothetical protein
VQNHFFLTKSPENLNSNNTISLTEIIGLSNVFNYVIVLREIQLLNANLKDHELLTRESPFTAMKFSAVKQVFIQQTDGVDTAYRPWLPPVDDRISPPAKFRGLFAEENSRIFFMSTGAARSGSSILSGHISS